MRTVDPVQWSRRAKPPIDVARPWHYRVLVVTAFERRLRASLRDAVEELLRNSSMPGVGALRDKRNPEPVRWCYVVLLVGMLAGGLAATWGTVAALKGRPQLVVIQVAEPHAAQEVDFPAVALCSYNTISVTELDRYAKYLYSIQRNNTYSLERLKTNLLAFSGLIASASQVSYDANFPNYLSEVIRETNVTHIIYKLSPKCESMLVRCSWRGARVGCDRLFALRITDVGYCCVFNARYSSEDITNPPYRVRRVGQDYGLSVVVKENTDDFTHVRRTGEELEMLIFDGTQYPLIRAGVVNTYPLLRNASVFVTLRATEQRASENLHYYTEAWRGCVLSYPDGRPSHSWSQCIAECRRKAALALCLCSPHTKPVQNRSSDDVTCSLDHLTCLVKHKEKLTLFYPGEEVHDSLSEEQADSVACLHCRPNCARLRYSATIWPVPYQNLASTTFHNSFVDGVKLENATVLRVYFTTEDQHLFLVEINMPIVDIIFLISSHCVFFVGAAVVTLLEAVYHCTVRWRHHYVRRRRRYNLDRFKAAGEMKQLR